MQSGMQDGSPFDLQTIVLNCRKSILTREVRAGLPFLGSLLVSTKHAAHQNDPTADALGFASAAPGFLGAERTHA